MRALWLIAVCSTPLAAHTANLELEVTPGFEWSQQIRASTPLLHARAGVQMEWFTVSIVGLAALLQDPKVLSHQFQDGGLRAWGLAAEVRFHTNGPHRFECGLGGGWGQLIALQEANGDFEGYRGHTAPYVEGMVGWLGVDLRLDAFNRVDIEGDLGVTQCPPSTCPMHQTFFVAGLGLSIAWSAGSL